MKKSLSCSWKDALQRIYWLMVRTFFWLIFHYVARIRFLHRSRLQERKAFILASNHISHFDPPCIGALCGRKVDWLTMDEMFMNPFAACFLTWLGCIKVNRFGNDRTALRAAKARLEKPAVVGIFPEGGIRAGETSILEGAAMKPGVAALSVLSEMPVLPCVILGTDRLYAARQWLKFRKASIWMVFGDWIECPSGDLSKKEAVDLLTHQLAEAFPKLQTRAIQEFDLTPDDLPTTPQRRKGRE